MSIKNVTQQKQKSAEKYRPKRSTDSVTDPVVRSLINKVRNEAKKPDDSMIVAAGHLREVRAYVEQHDMMGGKTWYEWAPIALRRVGGINKLRLLNELAEAPLEEARKILLEHRRNGAKRTRMSRERARAQAAAAKRMAIERQWIIRWAKEAQLQDIAKAWKYIKREFDA